MEQRVGPHGTELPTPAAPGCFATGFADGLAEIRNRTTGDRLTIRFDPTELPALGIWITRGGWNGYHHFAIEPTHAPFDSLADALTEEDVSDSSAQRCRNLVDPTGTSLRRLIAFTLAGTILITASLRAADISMQRRGQLVIASNGQINLQIHLDSGLFDIVPATGPGRIVGACAGLKLGTSDSKILTTQYPSHAIVDPGLSPLDDQVRPWQAADRWPHGSSDAPQLEQVFKIYDGKSAIFAELRAVSSESLQSNWMSPLIVEHAAEMTASLGKDVRLLQVPWDNDAWCRFNAQRLDVSAKSTGTSFEFTTIFDTASHCCWVIGSITHEFWKTGIDFRAGSAIGHLDTFTVYGGAATSDKPDSKSLPYSRFGTHDSCPHGAMIGMTIESPTISVGYFKDFRDGLEEYGRANAAITPPLPWKGDVPVGWMSFGAIEHVDLNHVLAASDFLHQHLQSDGFCDAHGMDCINIDSNHLTREQLRQAVDHIHQNHQLAGCYFSPFLHWHHDAGDPLKDHAGDSGLTIGQLALRDAHGNPIAPKDNSIALDVTNPATLGLIDAQIDQAKKLGFDYFKLDFLSAGALEGKYHDPTVHSGTQAYNRAMQHLMQSIGKDKFVSLSIAPMFPSQYGHSRRVSCDSYSQLNDLQSPTFRDFGSTEYMLSCDTFLWWMGGTVYPYNDPDAIELSKFQGGAALPEAWVKSRIISVIVCGGNYLDADDFFDPVAAQRADIMLTNPRINAVARQGIVFRPLFHQLGQQWSSKHDGTDAADLFYRDDSSSSEKASLVAVFNYDAKEPAKKSVALDEVGLPSAANYKITDLWTGQTTTASSKNWQCQLAAGEATLVRVSPRQ